MKLKIIRNTFIIILILVLGCSQNNSFKNVGDIPFDETVDDKQFKICNENNIKQYYVRKSSDEPPSYKGEKRGLENAILSKYEFPLSEKENGYLTIRFIVNCRGETGRFRMEEMDFDYQPIRFDEGIKKQLLEIVKNLNEWIIRKDKKNVYDFYKYISFKIKDGQIVKILP